jgi:5-methylcytosine-specific restriction endonuclease McrA
MGCVKSIEEVKTCTISIKSGTRKGKPCDRVLKDGLCPYHNSTKKKVISQQLRSEVWRKHVGAEKGKTICPICKETPIFMDKFSAGHVVAEAQGGELTVENLRPICTHCNSRMGTHQMDVSNLVYV